MLSGKSILITGGTGSFGQTFLEWVLTNHPDVRRVVVYSRDELKQFEMSQRYSPVEYKCLRYFIGDVRDQSRLRRALEGIDTVVHAAALKQVPAAEYNPFECISTNVLGAQNLIEASLDRGVRRVIALSTDKAAAPVNLYGATKLCSDKLFTAANNIKGSRDIRFSVVRYGNVMGSRGSVVPFFIDKRESGVLPITDPKMTRFNITLDEAVNIVVYAIEAALGGEVFVPKIPSYRILDLAEAIAPECKKPVIGIRPGEKIHEEMITSSDGLSTVDLGDYFAIVSSAAGMTLDDYLKLRPGRRVEPGFAYNSGTNDRFLTVEELRALIREHVDRSHADRSAT